jgi:flagellar motor switch protein FliG
MRKARSKSDAAPRLGGISPPYQGHGGRTPETRSFSSQTPDDRPHTSAISPLRKAAIVLVSLEHSLASLLLSHMDRSAVEAVTWEITRLESIDPAERSMVLEEFCDLGLRRLCFAFDDLAHMEREDICTAFQVEEIKTWALALAGATPSVRSRVLEALSASTANRLRHHLDHLGPFRLSDSETAQLGIAERLRQLHDDGRISLSAASGGEDALV